MSDTYQGWTNRETWAAHLWLTNSQFMYRSVRGMNAERLRDFCEGLSFARDEADFVREIGSLWRVNWDEISKALAGDVP